MLHNRQKPLNTDSRIIVYRKNARPKGRVFCFQNWFDAANELRNISVTNKGRYPLGLTPALGLSMHGGSRGAPVCGHCGLSVRPEHPEVQNARFR